MVRPAAEDEELPVGGREAEARQVADSGWYRGESEPGIAERVVELEDVLRVEGKSAEEVFGGAGLRAGPEEF